MRFEASIEVAAPTHEVFETYAAVANWPEWTTSVTSVERLDAGPLRVRSRARVLQEGPLGGLVGRLAESLTNLYLQTEVRGIKAHRER